MKYWTGLSTLNQNIALTTKHSVVRVCNFKSRPKRKIEKDTATVKQMCFCILASLSFMQRSITFLSRERNYYTYLYVLHGLLKSIIPEAII